MLRARRPRFWHWLALAAALLLVIAPPVSQLRQAQQQGHASAIDALQAVCTGQGLRWVAAATLGLPTTSLDAAAHALHPGHADAGADAHPPGHMDGHDACAYCGLAARLLPLLALLACVLALAWHGPAPAPLPLARHAPACWPAHGARGPPSIA